MKQMMFKYLAAIPFLLFSSVALADRTPEKVNCTIVYLSYWGNQVRYRSERAEFPADRHILTGEYANATDQRNGLRSAFLVTHANDDEDSTDGLILNLSWNAKGFTNMGLLRNTHNRSGRAEFYPEPGSFRVKGSVSDVITGAYSQAICRIDRST